MLDKVCVNTLLQLIAILFIASTARAEILQWYDGDGDGSLWLSDSIVEPYIDLSNQNLWWANLPFANLHHANLVSTNFYFAKLSNANLSKANLSYANLIEANLEETDLAYTIFAGANLNSSNIQYANLFFADLSDADMSNMKNWDSAFWLAARYNANTIFPEGMNPDDYGMISIQIPSPAAGIIFTGLLFIPRIRRV